MRTAPVEIGLKNKPERQTVTKQLSTEINELTPALTAPVRYPFALADGNNVTAIRIPRRRI